MWVVDISPDHFPLAASIHSGGGTAMSNDQREFPLNLKSSLYFICFFINALYCVLMPIALTKQGLNIFHHEEASS
jgi:hypothetical protein